MKITILFLLAIALWTSSCDNNNAPETHPNNTFDINEGQTNWVKIPYDTVKIEDPDYLGESINDIHFINNEIGFIVGSCIRYESFGIIYKTMDGGETWSKVNTFNYGGSTGGHSILMFDEYNGFVDGGGSLFLRTSDGCNTLHIIHSPSNSASHGGNEKVKINDSTAIIGCLRTFDYGTTWTKLQEFSNEYGINPMRRNISNTFFESGYGLYASSDGIIAETSDYGDSWNVLRSDPTDAFTTIEIVDSNVFIAGGNRIIKSIDKGLTWYETFNQHEKNIQDIRFINEQIGFATLIDNLDSNIYGEVLKTIDGGETWTSNYYSKFMLFYDIEIIDNQTIIIAGYNPKYFTVSDRYILKTTTQGN